MNYDLVRENVTRFLNDDTFIIPGIEELLPSGYLDAAIENLCELISEFSKTLPEGALSNPELFSQSLEKFFMNNEYVDFAYDGNTQHAYKEDNPNNLYADFIEGLKSKYGTTDLSSIKLSSKEEKNLNKILSHTFFPLVNGMMQKGEYGPDKQHRAICSGFAQLGCIISSCYGFECTPLAAQVFVAGSNEEQYKYAHYLSLIGKNGETSLLDLQSANTVYRMTTSNSDITTIDIETAKGEAIKGVDSMHSRMIFVATSEKRHEAFDNFNSRRFIQGGLGANVGGLVRVVGISPEISTCRFTLNESKSKSFVEVSTMSDSISDGGLSN